MAVVTVTCVAAQGTTSRLPASVTNDPRRKERAREITLAWIKRLRLVTYGGDSMRARFTYRGDSLWWFTELYLHKMRRLDEAVDTVLMLSAVRDRYAPASLLVETVSETVRDAALAFGEAHRIGVTVSGVPRAPHTAPWPGWLVGATARLSRFRPSRMPAPSATGGVTAFVHTAFWRTSGAEGPGQESYIGPVLGALAARLQRDHLSCVGVGPRRNFRARQWWDPMRPADEGRPMITAIERLAPHASLAGSRALWRRRAALAASVTSGESIREAAVIETCDLWPILKRELEGAAMVQWPWSARAMDEASAALDALAPQVVLTYAEAGGWGRALMLEARRRGVPSVGLQHGFIYRTWLNYRHEADEMQPLDGQPGFPHPDRTLLFDDYAARWLESAGHFPPTSLAVTGSARLDELAARSATLGAARQAVRERFGVGSGQSMAVLAAKFSEVQEELPALVAAVAAMPAMRLVIKTHPAETPDVYASDAQGASNVSVTGTNEDLAGLLAATDAVVTMNSTVAIDALVLGVPSLVLGLPNNLSPFVDAGAMIGVSAGGSPGAALEALLYDRAAREALLQRGAAFATRYGMRTDGAAATRAADLILGLMA